MDAGLLQCCVANTIRQVGRRKPFSDQKLDYSQIADDGSAQQHVERCGIARTQRHEWMGGEQVSDKRRGGKIKDPGPGRRIAEHSAEYWKCGQSESADSRTALGRNDAKLRAMVDIGFRIQQYGGPQCFRDGEFHL